MVQANTTIWDGEEFLVVTEIQARKLVKADKAQILSDGAIDGTELKTRSEFSGYNNKMMVTGGSAKVAKPIKNEDKKPSEENKQKTPPNKKVVSSKKIVAKAKT